MKNKSNFAGFLGTNSQKNWPISWEFLGQTSPKNNWSKTANFVVIFRENSLEIDRLIRPALLTFFKQRSSFALSTTKCSRNEPMAKPLTSLLVPSFSQHNLHLVVSGSCLHVSVTKFQDKFAEINFKYVVQTHIS